MTHLNIIIKGKVQGVGFRAGTKINADLVTVTGFAQNLPDGSVYIEAEGDKFSLDLFLDWCHEGPEGAEITSVETNEGELKNYSNFVVKR